MLNGCAGNRKLDPLIPCATLALPRSCNTVAMACWSCPEDYKIIMFKKSHNSGTPFLVFFTVNALATSETCAWALGAYSQNRLRDLTATFNLSCAFKAITLRHRDSVCKFILLLGLFTLHPCNSNSLCIGARWHFDRSVSEIMSRYEDISAPRSRKSFTLLTTNYVYMKIISISLSAILIHAELIMPLITIPSRIHRDQMS
jgi:hypothetical protein